MRWLVGAELALALVLLVGAGLMMKSFLALRAVNPGFDSRNVLTFHLSLPAIAYPQPADEMRVHTRIVEGLSALPGVESAALISNLPLGNSNWGRGFTIAGRPLPPLGQTPVALNRVVSPDYFRTMRTPVVRGRAFTDADTATSTRVAIIDESFVRQYFNGENPIGQQVRYGRVETNPWMEIVGVVADVRHYDLQNSVTRPGLFVPLAQHSAGANSFFVLRTATDPTTYASAVTEVVAGIDRGLAVAEVQPMSQWVGSAIWRDRLTGSLFAGFAGLALLLSALGVYGVTAFATTQRTREIGVRMALGAQPRDVLRLILGGGARLTAIALALGLLLAFGLTRFLGQLLYEVSPLDPVVFAGVALILALVACLASWLPARRAAGVDPVVALRAE
jgi:putative ABC transport system permease protein